MFVIFKSKLKACWSVIITFTEADPELLQGEGAGHQLKGGCMKLNRFWSMAGRGEAGATALH